MTEVQIPTYGSLYLTLCFVLCHFDFGVLIFLLSYFKFLVLYSVYDVVHYKRRDSRGSDKI